MATSPRFLVVDFHAESRFLLVKTLLRKFPQAIIHECDEVEQGLEHVRTRALTAVVAHRTFDVSGADVVRRYRAADPQVPIVMVSGMDRRAEALEAGATSFLSYEEWLRIGSVVEAHVNAAESPAAASEPRGVDSDKPRPDGAWTGESPAPGDTRGAEGSPPCAGVNTTP